jgi:hypothetical protein
MAFISHSKAFAAQADFAPEAKIKVGTNIWSPGVAGDRLFSLVLSKHPATVQQVLDLAAKLEPPFTPKATMGHLRWIFTAGELEVDGKSYVVQAKPTKAKVEPKAEAPKVEPKIETKVEAPKTEKPKAKVAVARKSVPVKTKKAA